MCVVFHCRPWYASQVGSSNIDDFWINPAIISIYKNHVQTLMTRKNTVTGTTYVSPVVLLTWRALDIALYLMLN